MLWPSNTNSEIRNRILRAISGETFDRLRPDLTEKRLDLHTPLCQLGAPVQHVWFLDYGMASLTHRMRDGRSVEVGVIGCDGVVGINAMSSALFNVTTKMLGTGRSISPARLAAEAEHDPQLMALLRGHVHLQLMQIAQITACNRLHNLQRRCARWLLVAHDNAGEDKLPSVDEFLKMVLGSRRFAVTTAMHNLQQSGYIGYSRGCITITNRKGLERASCECYAAMREETDKVFHQVAQATH